MAQAIRHVLLVDDDASLRRALVRTIRLAGYYVEGYDSVEALLAAGMPAETALLVLDVNLPGISGTTFKTTLVEAGRDVPTIFITALEREDVGARLAKFPTAAVLYKPLRTEELIATVHRFAGGRP